MKKSLTLVLAVTATIASAQTPQQIDIHKLPGGAQVVDQVVVPVPTEIFGVLDRQASRPRWHEVLRPIHGVIRPPGSQEQTALLLGTVIAEGFIAVEDKNSEEVKNIGRSVLILSQALGVKKVVVPRSNAIIQGAEGQDWTQVRKELDKAQREVQEAMKELSDEPLSQLVSLGGWLRGTEALTEVVKQEFNKDGAELLHQPLLLEHFINRINGFKPQLRNNPLVHEMKEGLEEMKPLMGTEDSEISEKTVDQMRAIAERLNKAIHAKN
jgi:hypothetical protein